MQNDSIKSKYRTLINYTEKGIPLDIQFITVKTAIFLKFKPAIQWLKEIIKILHEKDLSFTKFLKSIVEGE